MKIPCVCIDDKGRPLEVPLSKWVRKGNKYHITHVFHQHQQKGVKGVELLELDVSDCFPYNCFRMDRFAIAVEDIDKLRQLVRDCTSLDEIDISSIIEKLTSIEELENN